MRLAVAGCGGRMGRMLLQAVAEAPSTHLAGALERPGSDVVGAELVAGVRATDDPRHALADADGVLDFTTPAASAALAHVAAEKGLVHVIGSTGFAAADLAIIARAAEKTAVVRAGNMSLGVNLLVELTRRVAAALDPSYDVEIVEAHHNRKVDAPSGTALMLGEAAAAGRGVALDAVAERARDGITGARETGAIGFACVRGGDVVGEHDVIFAGAGERVVLRHIASDRMIFARGAVKAALWARGRAPGAYDMLDVLGLRAAP